MSDFEVILVDNGSTDKTVEILTAWQRRYPDRIRVFQEAKQGASATRNKGISESRGAWVQFLDSDDELLPEKISGQLNLVKGIPVGLVAGCYIIKGRKGLRKRRVSPEAWSALIQSRLGITSANLWNREWLDTVGWFSELQTTSEEYELMFRLLKSSAPVAVDEAFNTVKHDRQISLGKSIEKDRAAKIWSAIFELRLAIRDYLIGQQLFKGSIKRSWEIYMHSHLEHLKYKFPEVYEVYRPQSGHDLPFILAIRPVIGRELLCMYRKAKRFWNDNLGGTGCFV